MIRQTLTLALLASGWACQSQGVYGGVTSFSARHEDGPEAELAGYGVGWSGRMAKGSGFVEARFSEDDAVELRVTDLIFGAGRDLLSGERGSVRLRFDLGLSSSDLEDLSNQNELLSAGVGIYCELKLVQRALAFAHFGHRWYWDVTSPTTCNDGTTSQSVGQGACSHHGGIAQYNEYIGDADGPELFFGLLYTW